MVSGTTLREVFAAAELLYKDLGVTADTWSGTSCNELARDGQDAERHNRFPPEAKTPRKAYITGLLEGRQGPAIVATDYIRPYPDPVRASVPLPYTALGPDGSGRRAPRAHPRRHSELDPHYVAHAPTPALAAHGNP